MKDRSVSQQRIARDLGVSQALVSLVLNGKRENISEESYKRIWDYAVKMGYRPKGMQLGQNSAAVTSVGFILRAGLRLYTQSNFFSTVQHGLHLGLQERGLNTVYLGAEDDLDETTLKRKLRRGDLYGVVVLGEVALPFLNTIKKVHQRVVSVSASYPGLCQSVLPNEAQSAEAIVSHLVDQGHKHFAWLGGNKTLKQNVARRSALENSLQMRDLTLAPENSYDLPNGDRIEGRKAAAAILERRQRKNFPTAWVTLNALMARGAINLLMREGWKIPEQLSIVAVDATRVCVEEHPEITGANADPEKMGMKAAELLMQMSGNNDESMTDIIMPSQLTIRETSGKAP